MQMSVKFNNS